MRRLRPATLSKRMGNPAVLTGTPTPPFTNTKSLSLASASNQYVTIAAPAQSFAANQPWSVSLWIRFASYGAFATFLSSEGNAGVNFRGMACYISGTGSLGNWEIAALGGHVARISCAGAVVPINTWTHWVLTRDATATTAGMKWYKDGVAQSVTSVTNTLLVGDDTVSTVAMNVGRDSNGGANVNGLIDELSFWNVELSAADVTTLYNGGTPNDVSAQSFSAGLTGWYRWEDNFNDSAGANNGTGVNSPTFSTTVPP